MRETTLTPTELETLLGDATLIALTGTSEVRLVVLENQDYLLLVLNGSIQSVQRKSASQELVLPHQVPFLAELKSLPEHAEVLEFGLGGGSAMAHARYFFPTLNWLCLESNAEVISLYLDHFAPEYLLPNQQIVMADALQWLQQAPAEQQFDLILCDIFAKVPQSLLAACKERLKPGGSIVINWLPHLNQKEQPDTLELQALFPNWEAKAEKVPGFRNCIYRLQRPAG